MTKTGPCANCKRVLTIVSGGYCQTCYYAAKGLEGDEKAASLAAIKAKIEGGGLRKGGGGHRGPRKPTPAEASLKPGTDFKSVPETAPARLPEGTPSICLDFAEDRDRKIYDAVIEIANRLRREPDQQILWMLQNALEQETGLLAEASARG